MAVRYAVATGNWSSTSTWNGGTLPTSSDDVYANGFTVTINQNVTVISIGNTAQSPAVAGGGFILNDGVTVVTTSATSGFNVATLTLNLFTYNGSTSCSVTGTNTLFLSYSYAISNTFYHNGTGTLNIIGDTVMQARNGHNTLYLNGSGTINYTGNITVASGANEIRSKFLTLANSLGTVNFTGNIDTTSSATAYSYALFGTLAGKLSITGSLVMGYLPIISSGDSGYLSIIGVISNNVTNGNITSSSCVVRSSGTAINIFSGPFISGPYGAFPYQCVRMHLIPSTSNYIEFRDETTNGAVSPGPIAPATRMISPAATADNPIPANVRYGIVYSLGTQTGTLRMPVANQVTFGVAVDNTFGNAVLTASSVWNYLVSNITVADSIGMRLKNVATPQTMGEQLEAFLRLD